MFDLTKKYLRNTHDADGIYRKDMQAVWAKIPDTFQGIVHLLHPTRPMNIADIISESFSYGKDFPLENNCDVETNPHMLSDILQLLVNFDMIKLVQEEVTE